MPPAPQHVQPDSVDKDPTSVDLQLTYLLDGTQSSKERVRIQRRQFQRIILVSRL